MLHPEMREDKLIEWAIEEGIVDALQVPAKMLTVRNSQFFSSWLWLYHQSNTTIQKIIPRPTALTLEELNEHSAPLEYQQAAIQFLYDALEEKNIALEEEKEILQIPPPTQPTIKRIFENLQRERQQIREHALPIHRKN